MKTIIFKFAGGPLDGKKITGELAKDKEVRHYYALTHHGRLGQRFRTASDFAIEALVKERLQHDPSHRFQQHVYEVVDHIDNGNVMLVRIAYVAQEGLGIAE
ncbi:MAG: hypothetical protein ABSG68_12240 [Thermoguttaceae bacterium]